MMRGVFSKVMQVGRVTALALGVAVMVAVVLGLASAALAHKGDRGFFHLGHRNVTSTVSKLVGQVAGPSLLINNASEDPKATALILGVKDGRAPLRVPNPDAGKAKNLDADKLDGKDSSAFAGSSHAHAGEDITSGTVAEARIDAAIARKNEIVPTVLANDGSGSDLDADKLDGEDSTEFLPRRTYFKEITRDNSAEATTRVGFVCDPGSGSRGDMVLSGGYSGLSSSEGTVVTSRPMSSTSPNGVSYGWELVWENASPNLDSNVTVRLLCADFPPLRG